MCLTLWITSNDYYSSQEEEEDHSPLYLNVRSRCFVTQ